MRIAAMSMADLLGWIESSFMISWAAAVRETPKSLAIFAAWALLYFAVLSLRKREFSWRRVVADAFPRRMYSGPSFRVDFWNWLAWTVVFTPATGAILVVANICVGASVSDMLTHWLGPRPQLMHTQWVVIAVQFAGSYIGASFAAYWAHRASHRVPWLWSLHRAHHSTEVLTFFAGFRAHPLDNLFSTAVGAVGGAIGTGLVLYLTGTQLITETTVIGGLVALFYGASVSLLGHSHVRVSYGWFNLVIAGPIMHQIHHSAESRHRDKNFAAGALIFDWMFGTLYMPRTDEKFRFGLNEHELGEDNPHKTLKALYIEPLAHLWRELRGKVLPSSQGINSSPADSRCPPVHGRRPGPESIAEIHGQPQPVCALVRQSAVQCMGAE
jgi:sterol desaturase/sphingolipid hydroxylase (fatty acid hydroxylase superfamily)